MKNLAEDLGDEIGRRDKISVIIQKHNLRPKRIKNSH